MKKYILVVKNNVQSNLMYRFSTVAIFAGQALVFIFFFFLWNSIYASGKQIGSYSLKGMISYYLVLNLLYLTIKNNNVAWWVGDEIRLGEINNSIQKPFNYFGYIFAVTVGRLIYCLLVYSLFYLLLFILLKNNIEVSGNFYTIMLFVFLALLGFVINFLISYIIGLSAFWLGMIMGLNFALSTIITFLEGGIVPLDLLPGYINRINDFLPFKYVIFTPISLFTNRINFTWEIIAIPVLWITGLFILARFVYNKGIKKYEGYGT